MSVIQQIPQERIIDSLPEMSIVSQFQPIVSVKRKSIIGVEALSRGMDKKNGNIIPPVVMFHEAAKDIDQLISLDRACRETALLNFKEIKKTHEDFLLFLNIESSILDNVRKSNYLIKRVLDIGINPCDIVLEINESHIKEIDALINFVDRYREFGFIIALDDVGAGFSNLNRIPLLNPDIIKIDRFLLSNINNDHYKKEVFRSLVDLASNTGSLVIAEGVETLGEAIIATELGVDMIQGYYFSKPVSKLDGYSLNHDIVEFIKKYKAAISNMNKSKKILIANLNNTSSNVLCKLTDCSMENAEDILRQCIKVENDIECMYVLNNSGVQISQTVFKPDYQRKNKNLLFSPAFKGTDHSIKGYYYHLINNNNKNYISHKYMSMATGNMCITLSEVFEDANGESHILCIDFSVD